MNWETLVYVKGVVAALLFVLGVVLFVMTCIEGLSPYDQTKAYFLSTWATIGFLTVLVGLYGLLDTMERAEKWSTK